MTAFFGEKGQTGLAIFSHNFYSKPALLRSFDCIVRDLKWLTALVPTTKLDTELMRKRAGAYWAQASDVAAALVRDKGLSWRTAHQIVGILVRLSHERGIGTLEVDTKLLDEAAVQYTGRPIGLGEESLRKALDPMEFIKGRTLYGGPAPEESKKRIVDLSRNLEGDKEAVSVIRSRLQDANVKLERAIDGIIDYCSCESD